MLSVLAAFVSTTWIIMCLGSIVLMVIWPWGIQNENLKYFDNEVKDSKGFSQIKYCIFQCS